MAQVRNTFVKSKMNKDLDDRLLSNGEYRNAQNVNISRSEGEDVGALENVLGNELLTNFGLSSIENLEIIGYTTNETNTKAYFLATNYTDTSDDELSNSAPYGAKCYILAYDESYGVVGNRYKTLVEGRFLNFSKTHPIYGIDIIEDLLFWTDNRNQPRKINIQKATADSTYYTTEDQISVAKYYPYTVPKLYDTLAIPYTANSGNITYTVSASNITKIKIGMLINSGTITNFPLYVSNINTSSNQVTLNVSSGPSSATGTLNLIFPTSKNVTEQWLPFSSSARYESGTTSAVVNSITGEMPVEGMLVTCPNKIFVSDNVIVTSVTNPSSLNASRNIVAGTTDFSSLVSTDDIIEFSHPNGNYLNNWPGDEDYLKDKFVRFAYRFKFDDGEYSLISPFTQPAFIPKQDGYFMGVPTIEDSQNYTNQEDIAGETTIVSFFENKVNDVTLKIDTPFQVNQLSSKLKISEIDILYKESNGLAIQVLETIPITDSTITTNSTSTIEWTYQSRKPFKVLPEKETTRVFDKVPIRCMTQSVAGNRLIYGNFIDKHTPPQNLEYNVTATEKYKIRGGDALRSYCTVSYPNHTLKQNRTYQIGIVLADRYGRQSDVILSSLDDSQFKQSGLSETYNGSTIFHPYTNQADGLDSYKWRGDSLKILFRSAIPSTVTYADGYPGLYKSGEYTATVTPAVVNSTTVNLQSGTLDPNVAIGDIITGPATGGGTFTTSIKSVDHLSSTITVVDSISIDNLATVTMHGPANDLGWYTYKVVVKQTEQEYYNVYLPNICLADPNSSRELAPNSTTVGLGNQSFFTSLVSDNINKIAADLTEVQPEQTQFRTSDEILYPRIGYNSFKTVVSFGDPAFPTNLFVGTEFATAETIGKVNEIGLQTITGTGIKLGKISQSSAISVTPGRPVVVPGNTTAAGEDATFKVGFGIPSGFAGPFTNVFCVTGGSGYGLGDIITIDPYTPASTGYRVGDVTWTSTITLSALTDDNFDTEYGKDVQPLTAPGIYNDSSNPPAAQLSTTGQFKLGQASDKPFVFSVLEVKPQDSRLQIYWESSTSGLISELNSLINEGTPSEPIAFVPVAES